MQNAVINVVPPIQAIDQDSSIASDIMYSIEMGSSGRCVNSDNGESKMMSYKTYPRFIVLKKMGILLAIHYLFLITDAQDYFDINASTGEITLANSALSRGNRYTLLVKVSTP